MNGRIGARLVRRVIRTLPGGPAWLDAAAHFADAHGPADSCVILESTRTDPRWGRFSYLAAEPVWVLAMDRAGACTLTRPGGVAPAGVGPSGRNEGHDSRAGLEALRGAAGAVRLEERDQPGDGSFPGGWVGYFGYEFSSGLEGVQPAAADDIPLPRMRWAFYDAVARYEHATGRWELSALVLGDEDQARRRLARLEDRIMRAGRSPSPRPAPSRAEGPLARGNWAGSAAGNFTRAAYEQAVGRAKDYIAAGDIYQVNLSQRFTWPVSTGPALPGEVFAALRERHPACFSALLAWTGPAGDVQAVCSASPELFLSVRGRRVVTRPIKGTRPRGQQPADDRAAAAELLASAKDAAELAMIVDLERNDLGRVCRFGSVRVVEPRAVETHAHVHHTVATIEGDLADGRDVFDLLSGALPGGSVTGAPKIRAMEIIAELELTARSVYTGAIGYLGVDGSAMLNIAIRTVLIAAGQAHLQVGGGIVADSDPAAEYQETLDKAQGLAQAIAQCGAPNAEPGASAGAGSDPCSSAIRTAKSAL